MQLVSLSISGFKSFANDTKLEFAEGITAVVGPNGCGKSNVVDALRWVLGEQRSAILRSERMENVIFNGTLHRKPLNLSDVRVVVDNHSQRINLPYSEIEIARRLHRDGTSEYMINGTQCRLRDITDMLRDSGMGPNMYSILELKMVESILRDDGEGRRSLFEEASGIAQYKLRRRQAMNKLTQTEEDLLRLADIVHEVERQVASLKRQVSKARRYKAHSERLRLLESALMYREYVRIKSELSPLEESMKESVDSSQALRSAVRSEEAKLEEIRRELIDAEQETGEFRRQLELIVSAISTLEAESAGHRATLDAARDTVERTDRQRILGNEKRERYEERRAEESRHRGGIAAELEVAEQALRAAVETFSEGERVLNGHEREAQAHEEELQTLRERLAQQQSARTEFFAARASVAGRKESAEHALEEIAKQRDTLADETAANSTATAEIRATESESQSRTEEAQRRIQELETRREELRERSRVLDAAVHSAESRLELLATLAEKGPRSSQAIRTLREAELPGLTGLLGDEVNVDERYRKAIQSVLGPAAYYYLAHDLETTTAALGRLRETGAGQAGIITIEDLEPTDTPHDDLPDGGVAWGIDLVHRGEKSKVVQHYLGRVLIVDHWDSAFALRDLAREKGYTIVTLAGEWIDPHGVVKGGSTESRAPVDLGLSHQTSELRQILEETKREAAQLETAIEEVEGEIEEARSRHSDCSRDLDKYNEQLRDLRDQEVKLSTLQTSLDSRERAARGRISECDSRIDEVNTEIASTDEGIARLDADLAERSRAGEKIQRKVTAARDALNLKREEMHARERGRDSIQHRLTLSEAEIERIEQNLDELTETMRGNEEAAEKAANDIERLEKRLQEIQSELAEKFKLRDSRVHEVDTASVKLDQIRGQITDQESAMRKLRSGQEEALEGERQISVEVARLQGELEALLTSARHQHNLNPADPDFAAQHPEIREVETSAELVQELKQRIESLGPVNLLAVEEYDQESARLEEMLRNREDLLQAKRTLEETIRKINETAEAKFLHTFEAVRENFQTLFVEFFPAGEADLILTGKDLLEADITMWANPSGKRLKSLNLMSGGEKTMTAIALLFSLYRVKPSPFCVLDEVDAPLDDANIDRFTRMLRHHSGETQFILVTHNKRTMEIADNLYGVTMQEEGVSKLVSVRLLSEEAPVTS